MKTVLFVVLATAGILLIICQGILEIRDAVTVQGKSIVEAIDCNTEAIRTQTNRCTLPTRGSP